MTSAPEADLPGNAARPTFPMSARGVLRTWAPTDTVELDGERDVKAFWYLCSGLMVVNGLFMALALHRYAEGIMFVAIGVAFVFLRQWRLRRDRSRTFE
jgi:hypothetical protein